MITNSSVGTSYSAVFTASTDVATTVIYFCNTSGSSVSLDICLVPSGGTAGTSNQIVKSYTVAAGNTYIMDAEKILLQTGDTIQAQGNATGITATVISTEI